MLKTISYQYVSGYSRDRHLKRAYGIDRLIYHELSKKQGGRCAICSDKPKRWLTVDHCHKTKIVRGLLCQSCNKLIGNAKESKRILLEAITYLSRWKAHV